ncbi:hypothetical protein ON010_g15327 [Phytophthora cinnamomi]|nr:hypothetical protein ON010_g15327 [Phytophthora cinnamomi]
MASSRIDLAHRATSLAVSDNLVGIILPRIQAKYHASAVARPARKIVVLGSQSTINADSRADQSSERYHTSDKTLWVDSARSVASFTNEKMGERRSNPSAQGKPPTRELFEYKVCVQRERCRFNRAHYRNKQRQYQLELAQNVTQLRQEVNRLARRAYRTREGVATHSSSSQVIEIFMLLHTRFHSAVRVAATEQIFGYCVDQPRSYCFRPSSFAEATVEDLYGVDALMTQLQPFLLCFKDSSIQLQRVRFVTEGVIEATAWINITVSELTLQRLVPEPKDRGEVRDRLLGQRLRCKCVISFLLNEADRHVAQISTQIDFIRPLFDVLGDHPISRTCWDWCDPQNVLGR